MQLHRSVLVACLPAVVLTVTLLPLSPALGAPALPAPGAAVTALKEQTQTINVSAGVAGGVVFSGKTRRYEGNFKVGHLKRRFIVRVPLLDDKDSDRALAVSVCKTKRPVVIVLHGALGNAWTAEFDSVMTERAAKEGFVVVYPYGTGIGAKQILFWNAGACCSLASLRKVDDVAFIRQLIAVLKRDYNADESRIYVAGASNGGMMAYRLAAELSDKIAAIGSVEGCMFPGYDGPKTPVSVIEFHGTADGVIPFAGGTGSLMGYKVPNVPAVLKTMNFWIDQDHCRPQPKREISTGVVRETYDGGEQGTAVCLVKIEGGGHSWPGGRCAGVFGDKPSLRVNATDEMLAFFKDHPKQTR